jgi:ATP-dependent DNA ligase
LDGEIVALDERGRHSFALLQNIKTSKAPLLFYVFDLLHIDGEDLTKKILEKRRRRLEEAFDVLPERVQLSPILAGEASDGEHEGISTAPLDANVAQAAAKPQQMELDLWSGRSRR